MKFTKMHGAGNDYIYVNCFDEIVKDPKRVSIQVSDRHFGIGSDGLVLIEPSEIADFKMDIYNADGSQAKMCGNATRCVAKYVYDNKLTDKNEISLETLSGIKHIKMKVENGRVTAATVNMGAPVLRGEKIPVRLTGETVVNRSITAGGEDYNVTCVSMGNPHCIIFIDGVNELPLEKIGPIFENHELFPDRINTEFVERADGNSIKIRVWERGSGETLACGTGACASAVACVLNGYCKKDEDIRTILRGGELIIRWDSASNNVFMTGPAATVCTGEIEIEF
ncbi:MAG: diaminopimelate epimerase [Clostridiales bacterium]|nr:diaminopimelate epimerase [Clostridiales bacterium]